MEIFDTYTIRKNNACTQNGHSYVYDGEYILCTECGYCMTDISSFSGLITDTEGRNMFFTNGVMQTGWIPLGEDYYYFGEDGRGADGETVLQESYDGNSYGDISFTFENGLLIGGYTGWYGEKYYVNGRFITGWVALDDGYYYLAGENERYNACFTEVGNKLTGYSYVYTPMGSYFTSYYLYFDENGKYMHGDFHLRGDQIHWSYTDVRPYNRWKLVGILCYQQMDRA